MTHHTWEDIWFCLGFGKHQPQPSYIKCCHISLLFSFASSFTLFILWSITGFHLVSHSFNCWFVSSDFSSSELLNIFNSSSDNTISCSVYRCVTFFVSEVYSATTCPPSIGLFLSMHLSVHISCTMRMMAWKNAWKVSVLFFFLFDAVVSFAFLFLLLFTLAYVRGCFSFLLFIYAFCCIFHCLENNRKAFKIVNTTWTG